MFHVSLIAHHVSFDSLWAHVGVSLCASVPESKTLACIARERQLFSALRGVSPASLNKRMATGASMVGKHNTTWAGRSFGNPETKAARFLYGVT
eukprot:6415286-Prymnesium_polylepis.1